MKTFCNTCKISTNFEIKREYSKVYNDDSIYMKYKWQIIECKGCETVSFRTTEYGTESGYDDEGNPVEDEIYYPKHELNTLNIKPFYNTPHTIKKIYREMIDCYNNGSYILCAGGLRAVLESICQQEYITDGIIEYQDDKGKEITKRTNNLQGKISGMQEKGLITTNHSEILHQHRFLGNEALHELSVPSQEELKIAIGIIEQTIDNIYELSEKAEELKELIEKRKKKQK
jgi:hypothetical protein